MSLPAAPTGLTAFPSTPRPGAEVFLWDTQDDVLYFLVYVDNLAPVNAGISANNSNTSQIMVNGPHAVSVSAVNTTGEGPKSAAFPFTISNSPLMLTTFDQAAAADTATYLTMFGEPIIYTPNGGADRPINAIVTDRDLVKNDQYAAMGLVTIDLLIAFDEVLGITGAAAGDAVTVFWRFDKAPKSFLVQEVVGGKPDGGMWNLIAGAPKR